MTLKKNNFCYDLTVLSSEWYSILDEEGWEQFFEKILCAIASFLVDNNNMESGCISIALVDDKKIKELNTTYRKKNAPTNVLAFPQYSDDILGDVVLSVGVIKQEAYEQRKKLLDHVSHLTIHGILHLLGYDHIHNKEREEMEQLEIKILECLGVENPYE